MFLNAEKVMELNDCCCLIDIETAELPSNQFNIFSNRFAPFKHIYESYKNKNFHLDKFYTNLLLNKSEFNEF